MTQQSISSSGFNFTASFNECQAAVWIDWYLSTLMYHLSYFYDNDCIALAQHHAAFSFHHM